jgi:hypothetical protein
MVRILLSSFPAEAGWIWHLVPCVRRMKDLDKPLRFISSFTRSFTERLPWLHRASPSATLDKSPRKVAKWVSPVNVFFQSRSGAMMQFANARSNSRNPQFLRHPNENSNRAPGMLCSVRISGFLSFRCLTLLAGSIISHEFIA